MKHNLKNMMALDLYLSSLSQDDYSSVIQELDQKTSYIMPLMSWDFHSISFNKQLLEGQRQQDILKVVHLAEKYHWQNRHR